MQTLILFLVLASGSFGEWASGTATPPPPPPPSSSPGEFPWQL